MKLYLPLLLLLAFFLFTGESFGQKGPKNNEKGHPQQQSHHKEKKGNGPPPWAPAHGYRAKTRHVYFPEYESYYDIQRGVYISLKNGKWEVSAKLPLLMQNINLKLAKQVELELDSEEPQKYFKNHKSKYPKK